MSDNWNGDERRSKSLDHDLLIRIDSNLSNFMRVFAVHEKKDDETFAEIDRRLKTLEKVFYGVSGIFVFVQILSKFIK